MSENIYHAGLLYGSVEVITGSMFSGKTEELIRRIKRAQIARLRVIVFKPVTDKRFAYNNVVSHNEQSFPSTPVKSSDEILMHATDKDVIGIDEAQFFDTGLVDVVTHLSDHGKRIILSGLDMDFKRSPFNPMPQLMAIADEVTKVHAVCMRCGRAANYSFRKTKNEELIVLGSMDIYEPLCRECFIKATANI